MNKQQQKLTTQAAYLENVFPLAVPISCLVEKQIESQRTCMHKMLVGNLLSQAVQVSHERRGRKRNILVSGKKVLEPNRTGGKDGSPPSTGFATLGMEIAQQLHTQIKYNLCQVRGRKVRKKKGFPNGHPLLCSCVCSPSLNQGTQCVALFGSRRSSCVCVSVGIEGGKQGS
uniref:Uncharacterized protein n=1 Tax=Palpitomonas bilix TaxID=652834 RepID=A0A7S3CVF2_9EUKA